MKNLFLKKIIPILVFVLGILGAFGTMSMQSAEELAPKTGWATNHLGPPYAIQIQKKNKKKTIRKIKKKSGKIT